MPSKIASFPVSYLIGAKGSSHIVAAPTVVEGLRLFLSALRSIGDYTAPTFMVTMVKRSISINGHERVISQVPVPVTPKMLAKIAPLL
jgi:hypothetical protein